LKIKVILFFRMSPRALASLVKQMAAPGGGGGLEGAGAQLAATLSCEQAAELRAGAGHLGQRLRHVEAALDSDVTASSSGGDSCDEAAGFSAHNTRTLPMYANLLISSIFYAN
jgi:hypothetical protein